MRTFAARLLAIAAGGLLLWLIHLLLDPVPLAAGPAYLLGAACMLVPALDQKQRLVNLAALAGAVGGALVHRGWHVAGRSPAPPEGLVQHVLFEGLLGLLAALLCLGAAYLLLQRYPSLGK